MASTQMVALMNNVSDHVAMVWVELTLAIVAAIAYHLLSGRHVKKCSPPAKAPQAPPQAPPETRKSAGNTPVILSAAQVAFANAIKLGKLSESIAVIQQLPETIAGSVPPNFATRLLRAVANAGPNGHRLNDVLSELQPLRGKIAAGSLEIVITDAAKNKEVTACRRLHAISSQLQIPKSRQTFQALASAYTSDAAALHGLVEEVHAAAFRMPLPLSFARVVLDACVSMRDMKLAADVLEKCSSSDAVDLRCVLEHVMGHTSDGGVASGKESPRSNSSGDKENSCMKDVALRANDIRSCGRNGDLKGAIKVFERLGERGEDTLLLNSIMDACVECKDPEKADQYFDRAKHLGLADVISYNTMMKCYLASGQAPLAERLLKEIPQKGLTPTRASYHGLLNARVNSKDFSAAWKLVSDMQASGTSPNAVTCSILLKGKLNSPQEVSRVLALIDAMEEPMDEVLFLSVVEACIRTGRLDALSRQTGKFMQQSASAGLSAPTYGSMIKAYGRARDVKKVWELWHQMIAHHVLPTSVTLGCMVEALVANGCTSDAWKLTQKMWNDEATRSLVNTVIYSSILKGFANAEDTEKVMALYEEMRSHQIQPNTITFNTILNAFAKGGTMHRVPPLLEDMASSSPPVEPDIVSYSTIVKGYCSCGNLDRALKVARDMKAHGKYTPDEVMYNSLLGGCAKEHRADEAIELLNDMRKFGVAPSNYTLSMLVKLMGRCRRINDAFTMLEDISREYGLRINIQVYTCLIQGCFNAGQALKGIALHDKIIQEGLIPDAMTYTVLVRGCLQSGLYEQAVHLVKCAHGKAPEHRQLIGGVLVAAPGLNAGCIDELMAILSSQCDEQSKTLLSELSECKLDCARPAAPKPYRHTSSGPYR